jgi:hypothetical protein
LSPRPRGLRSLALAAVVFATLTVALTWPLAAQLHVVDAGDSAFFAWQIGWELHALKTDPVSLPHANIFHPLRYTLGMDEPVLGTTLLLLPFVPFTDDAVFLFNVARLLTFFLSALAAWALARELGLPGGPALFAGAAFAFSPIRTDQIAHLSTLGTQWLPLLLLFIVRFARTGRLRDAALAGIFFVLETLACGYHGLIGLAVLPVFALTLVFGRWDRLRGAALATALAGLLLLPLFILHRKALDPEGYSRNSAETAFFSASLESFLATTSWNRLHGGWTEPFRNVGPNNLFPGLVVPGLALAGALALRRRKEQPGREAVALAALALAAALVCLGPEIRLFGQTLLAGPMALLRELPVFRMIRVSSRAGIFLALPLALLAAKALSILAVPRVARLVLGLLALTETLIVPIPSPAWAQVVDTRLPPPPVYAWLAEKPGSFAILELPMLRIDAAHNRPAHHESIYMVNSTRGHWKRLVNGYAGIEPMSYQRIRELCRTFPTVELLRELRRIGVRYVVVHGRGFGPNQWGRLQSRLPHFLGRDLVEAARFESDVVYELQGDAGGLAPD